MWDGCGAALNPAGRADGRQALAHAPIGPVLHARVELHQNENLFVEKVKCRFINLQLRGVLHGFLISLYEYFFYTHLGYPLNFIFVLFIATSRGDTSA